MSKSIRCNDLEGEERKLTTLVEVKGNLVVLIIECGNLVKKTKIF